FEYLEKGCSNAPLSLFDQSPLEFKISIGLHFQRKFEKKATVVFPSLMPIFGFKYPERCPGLCFCPSGKMEAPPAGCSGRSLGHGGIGPPGYLALDSPKI
ncbi:MAG: hypothetical protein KDD02_27205, partial [Phaeodactylibacter sp.]|nr:hypothetical protein [Phaeodactylibacter sp.]